jgi:hypothetical protein
MRHPRAVVRALSHLEETRSLLVDIGHRGGHFGARTPEVLTALWPTLSPTLRDRLTSSLPPKIGALCNYLGGGVRGAVVPSARLSDFISHGVPVTRARVLAAFANACVDRYIALEGLEDQDEDGTPDWDAIATNAARRAGVVSAY